MINNLHLFSSVLERVLTQKPSVLFGISQDDRLMAMIWAEDALRLRRKELASLCKWMSGNPAAAVLRQAILAANIEIVRNFVGDLKAEESATEPTCAHIVQLDEVRQPILVLEFTYSEVAAALADDGCLRKKSAAYSNLLRRLLHAPYPLRVRMVADIDEADEGPVKTQPGMVRGADTVSVVPEYAQWTGEVEAVVRFEELGLKDKQAAKLALQNATACQIEMLADAVLSYQLSGWLGWSGTLAPELWERASCQPIAPTRVEIDVDCLRLTMSAGRVAAGINEGLRQMVAG